ncbi:MAG: oligosaccharide flippase family protein [Bacteroidaceae bacterium]|nr:oligosaccharide flippase family protein [Bacteroidaceae bacterium]
MGIDYLLEVAYGSDRQFSDSDVNAYSRIVRCISILGGVQWLTVLINVIRTKIVARLLGMAGFGINESFNRTLNLVKSATDLGIPFSAVRTISAHFDNVGDKLPGDSILITRSWALITALCGMLVCALLAPLFSLWAFDGDRSYTLSFMLLSPVVAFSAISGGETAVLKGIRKVKEIAQIQLFSVVSLLLISVPVFYFLRLRGLVLSLVLVSMATMVITCVFSFRAYPYRVALFNRAVLRGGSDMIYVGVYFTLTSFFNAGAFSIVANYLMSNGGKELVGAYSAGYALVSYLGMFVFSAMDYDYFPRIASVIDNNADVRTQMNRQIEVTLLLVTPMVTAFVVFLEPIVRVLLTEKFCVAIPMTQLAVLGLLFKAVSQPMAYIPLAKGDSKTYLLQELVYDVSLAVSVILCFQSGGLRMVGLALTVAEVLGLAAVYTIVRIRYRLTFQADTVKLALILPWPALLAYVSVVVLEGWTGWVAGCAAIIVSALFSYMELARRTDFMDMLKMKFRK